MDLSWSVAHTSLCDAPSASEIQSVLKQMAGTPGILANPTHKAECVALCKQIMANHPDMWSRDCAAMFGQVLRGVAVSPAPAPSPAPVVVEGGKVEEDAAASASTTALASLDTLILRSRCSSDSDCAFAFQVDLGNGKAMHCAKFDVEDRFGSVFRVRDGELVLNGFGNAWSHASYDVTATPVDVCVRCTIDSEVIIGFSKNCLAWGKGGDALTFRLGGNGVWVRTGKGDATRCG